MFSGDQRLHIVIVIPWIHHDDLIVIRDQKRHKTVCIRIFKDQQTFCRIICRRNINLRMIRRKTPDTCLSLSAPFCHKRFDAVPDYPNHSRDILHPLPPAQTL